MLLKQYFNRSCRTIRPIEPYGRLLGATMYWIPEFHFDPDPLYRETVVSQGWDPERDESPKLKTYNNKLQEEGVQWLRGQKKAK